MRKVLNYLGQLRLYSLVDLMLMLLAAGASAASPRFWGAVFLWVGFLAHLEAVHHDKGRESVPRILAWLLWLQALKLWYDNITGDVFILSSLVYAQKKNWRLGLLSPLMRGLQTLVIVGSISGYDQVFTWLAAALTIVRNLLGDLRDSQEDAEEAIRTWPSVLGLESRPFAHYFGMFGTTIVWWVYAGLPAWVLLVILIFETATYWLTPRPSNKNAAVWLRKILRFIRG